MVVGDLDCDRTRVGPNEADTIPLVDTNTMLTTTISGQSFKPVAGRCAEISQRVSKKGVGGAKHKRLLGNEVRPSNSRPFGFTQGDMERSG